LIGPARFVPAAREADLERSLGNRHGSGDTSRAISVRGEVRLGRARFDSRIDLAKNWRAPNWTQTARARNNGRRPSLNRRIGPFLWQAGKKGADRDDVSTDLLAEVTRLYWAAGPVKTRPTPMGAFAISAGLCCIASAVAVAIAAVALWLSACNYTPPAPASGIQTAPMTLPDDPWADIG
jgi:hypothetical protein